MRGLQGLAMVRWRRKKRTAHQVRSPPYRDKSAGAKGPVGNSPY